MNIDAPNRAVRPPPPPPPTTTTTTTTTTNQDELVSFFEQIQTHKLSEDVRRTAACNVLRVFAANEPAREKSA